MSANEFYVPAYVGGIIRGAQIVLENITGSNITAAARNGVYYVYQGHKFQLLGCDSVTIPAGKGLDSGQQIYDNKSAISAQKAERFRNRDNPRNPHTPEDNPPGTVCMIYRHIAIFLVEFSGACD